MSLAVTLPEKPMKRPPAGRWRAQPVGVLAGQRAELSAAAGSAGALPEAVLPESDAGEPVVTEADTEATAEATPAAGAELADAAVTDAEPEAEAADDAGDAADQPADEPQAEASPAAANDEPEAGRPKRRGWWSLG